MAYRTYINHVQIFGNHEYYPEWIDFIKAQGIKVDEDGHYEGRLTNFNAALKVIEQIVINLEKERRAGNSYNKTSLFNCSYMFDKIIEEEENDKEDYYKSNLLDELINLVDYGYLFLPYNFFKICEPYLKRNVNKNGRVYYYEFKENEYVDVSAY